MTVWVILILVVVISILAKHEKYKAIATGRDHCEWCGSKLKSTGPRYANVCRRCGNPQSAPTRKVDATPDRIPADVAWQCEGCEGEFTKVITSGICPDCSAPLKAVQ